MEFLGGLWTYVIPFLVVLTVLVFVHELGHYWVARRNGVRIETFSIGFGPELFGRTDKAGTRWKFSAIPLGGYVKMFGDADAASTPSGAVRSMTPAEREISFFHKRLGQRAAIVAAGPIANFLFAIIGLTLLFSIYGQPFTPADIGSVQPESAAAQAGMLPGDVIVEVDGQAIERFEEVQQIVRFNQGTPLALVVQRDGQRLPISVTPQVTTVTDRMGNSHTIGLLGIGRAGMEYRRHDPLTALWQAGRETVNLTVGTLGAVGQMVSGSRGTEELGGPLRIAQMSGEVAQSGIVALIWFMAILSVNLGLINLFPIPMLDGGHLLFYAVEAIRGKPLGDRAQEYGFRIGLALVLTLMVFATWNDLVHLRVVDFFRDLIS
ncbi:regulator of sigma E protease [Skermanella aerolata]|uniref:Zinc metalloprotease n=1 Tax=Skermanella aerolata TaxID=393310 RepID=A0A512DJY6_9PROT|nr:RIP metalloprotease RseP [Skermanella aerolata]KJB97024.1 zinc metalloprotease [Skermanella aerolata KACC 11604]GEO36786.1 zinc metalloprotease [Skermanella aerolata]